jgi:transcription-repair coupling factor (superfamily II helicase)
MLFSALLPKPPTTEGNRTQWGTLHEASAGLCITNSSTQHNGITLVICKNTQEANLIEQEIRFFKPTLKIIQFPDWETLPYDNFSPHQDIISARLEALYALPQGEKATLIVPVNSLLNRLCPTHYIQQNSLSISKGQTFNIDNMRLQLSNAGYQQVDNVYDHGEYSVRGAIMDIYPMGLNEPYRIELFDDEVETLRSFDPETQRSVKQYNEVKLLPAKEFPLDSKGIRLFKQKFIDRFDVDYRACPIYQDISGHIPPAGIEYYLPLFFEETSSLFDYLPPNSLVFMQEGAMEQLEHQWEEITSRHEDRRYDVQVPILNPDEIFISKESFFSALKKHSRIDFSSTEQDNNFNCSIPPELTVDGRSENPLIPLLKHIEDFNGRILFAAETAGRREALLTLFKRSNIKPKSVDSWHDFTNAREDLCITIAPLARGAILLDPAISLISESQLFGKQIMQRRRRKQSHDHSDQIIKNLTELNLNAPVVHIDHGVGRYKGLETLTLDGQATEFLTLAYANEAKLYVPVSNLHMIARYSGGDEQNAPLHRLGSDKWSTAKRKAAEKAHDAAAELLDIYARREAKKGFSFSMADDQYQQFSASFGFEETVDQENAIETVLADMQSEKCMDRLVCGDVGFGKTEVAMRAAFMAIQSDKQVAILVPTTLLAQQHYDNFCDRFADWPVNIEVLSRFKSGKQLTLALEEIRKGKTDIIIGTHKLLQKDLVIPNLGLLIIDEEHRFGVQQKEKIKSLRANIDILTLTATPIPRTLNMAMSGIRDLSIIATPPAKRLSVKTFVRQSDDKQIKEAILREILRGGQVYLLHNEVKNIEKVAQDIRELVPEARVGVGHGQMSERELEHVMGDFYHKRSNVLVCTTIIETGIDIPSANTIIIERADKFGLAQLHQLRGRVGRSHHQAYAYLLTPNPKTMSKDAHKRLEAIAAAADLGAGFTLATHDMEIRGAGEFLGEDQSGQMQQVGFTMYLDMLEQAVKAIKEGKTPNADQPLAQETDINLRIPALIPDDYLPDVHTRLTLYKRIASSTTATHLKELQVEMIDRFGLLPEPTKHLFRLNELKQKIKPLGIAKLDVGQSQGTLEFTADTLINPANIISLIQQRPANYKLDNGMRLKFFFDMPDVESRFNQVYHVIEAISTKGLR